MKRFADALLFIGVVLWLMLVVAMLIITITVVVINKRFDIQDRIFWQENRAIECVAPPLFPEL